MTTTPAKVKSVRQVRTGRTQAAAPGTTPTPELTLEQVVTRWKPHQEEVRGLPWSAVPDAMLQDFLRASVGAIQQIYGDQAPAKSAEVLAIMLASSAVGQAQFIGAWTGTNARLQVDFELRDVDQSTRSAPEVGFSMEVPQDADEAQIRQSLADWANHPPPDTRLLLDPAAQIPPGDLRLLIQQVEQALGDQDDVDSQQDALMATSALLIIWKQMEHRNAALADFVMSGLTMGDEEIASGREAVIHVTCLPLDPAATPFGAVEEETKPATIRYRPH